MLCMDGTLQLSINLILYLIVIIFFPLSKRNKYFGLRFKKCFLSEKLWHKIHLRASIVTIPFALLDLVLIFVEDISIKKYLAIIILVSVIILWNLVVKFTSIKEQI